MMAARLSRPVELPVSILDQPPKEFRPLEINLFERTKLLPE